MALIKSISGIRGTLGGRPNEGLTPVDVVKYVAAYAEMLKLKYPHGPIQVAVGRDARTSGPMLSQLVCATLSFAGIDVDDLALATTPTVEMHVLHSEAKGGIILTASHNPAEWNALKLLNEKGEFISAEEGARLLELADEAAFSFAPIPQLGKINQVNNALERHIEKILQMPWVKPQQVAQAKLKVVIDPVNSVGAIAVPALLEKLGVQYIVINAEPNGHFAHNPEPLPEHLTALSEAVVAHQAHLGICVDPDVDRLALVCENGDMFGEEYTLVAIADYVLEQKKGAVISNLSSSRALADVANMHGCAYAASAVGEVHVVKAMKENKAVLGGEGNGGIICPDLHYGRDALAGLALFLSHLAISGKKASEMRAALPGYEMSKDKIDLPPHPPVDEVLEAIKQRYAKEKISTLDGVKIDFPEAWVHLRKSNTEPIIRIYAEAKTLTEAQSITQKIKEEIMQLTRGAVAL